MDKADLVKVVGWRLGDREDMADRIDLELDILQDTVLEAKPWHPWFLESELAYASTFPNERRVPLPVDFLGELEESHLYLVEPTTLQQKELVKKDADVGLRTFPYIGTPIAYAISGLYFQFFPKPDDAYPIAMRYYAKDVRISSATADSRWMKYAPDIVLAELCLALASKHIKDPEAAQGFAQDAQVAWKRLYDKHVAMAEINQPRSLGGNT
jgi:hypothetical protein